MRKINILFLILLLNLTFCKNEKSSVKNSNKIDEKLESVINHYIKEYPIKPIYKSIFFNPSYNVHFDIFENDTIMAIVLLPGIDNFFIYNSNINGYKYTKEDGFYIFEKKNPVVFFNSKLYNESLYSHLIKEIPDSLKYKVDPKIIANPPFTSEELALFKIKNNIFIPIIKNDSTYKKLVTNYNINNPHIE